VSLGDVAPTLLGLSGLRCPPVDGVSLVPHVMGVRAEQLDRLSRPLFLVEARQHGVIQWPWKLLVWQDQGLVELYNLAHDFDEEMNRADELPELVRQLGQVLSARRLTPVDRLHRRPR
jgi:arylsulfatase A-like enzyme